MIQRARILTAMVDETTERGAGNLTVARVVARTGVSRRTFYELFESCEDCLLEAFEEAIERLAAVVVPAYEQPRSWRAKIRGALTAALECMARDPSMGRLLVVDSLGAGAPVVKRRAWLVDTAIDAVEEGRREPNSHGDLPFAAEGVVGGVLSVLHARLLEGDSGRLVELVNPLMSMVVLPYLGPAAARKELEGPVLVAPATTSRRGEDPLRELDMRLTYRTVRVLRALAVQPGSSNRQVGDGAEVGDPGQTSKLLARLQGLGLVENVADRSIRGAPNSWTLTHRGWEVQAAIGSNTTPPD
jgi:AcrR family transcriptional regulator